MWKILTILIEEKSICILQNISEWTERMSQGNKWTFGKIKAKRDGHSVDCLQKRAKKLANLESRFSKNVQDVRRSHKIHHGSHGKLESGIDRSGKIFGRDENPEGHLSRRCTFTFTIFKSIDVTQMHTKKVHWGFQI